MATYTPHGVCARQIDFEIDAAGNVHDVQFTGGCGGNKTAVSRLAEGQSAEQLIAMLRGIPCGQKGTSCPDQLAEALSQELAKAGQSPV
ncbi:MAG: TIGR03905 family TSCPD domain-containing protein [Actinomycetia bacterium]|nr:TIGR03905 family TSCPD domain-containing protein [Actinomycetes bacterium]